MENEFLINLVDEYFDKNPGIYFSFDNRKLIPNRKLKNAIKLYAPYNKEEEIPILLVDDTLFRTAKLGMLLTNKYLYFRFRITPSKWDLTIQKIPLNKISTLSIKLTSKTSILLVNGNKVASVSAFGNHGYKKTETEVLNNLFDLIMKALQQCK